MRHWMMCECGDRVFCVTRDDDTIKSIAWCGVTPVEIATSVVLAHACDGDLVGLGYDNLLLTLPDEDVVRAVRDPDGLLVDGDFIDMTSIEHLTQVHASATSFDELCQALLSDQAVLGSILDAMPGYELVVTVDGFGKKDLCDPAFSDFFGPDDTGRAACVIGDLDVERELVTSDSVGITHGEGACVNVCLVREADELVLCEQRWGWEQEHDLVRHVYNGLLSRAGLDVDAFEARPDELPEWARGIDWDFDCLDRVSARCEVDQALVLAGDDEQRHALLWASDTFDTIVGRHLVCSRPSRSLSSINPLW